MGGPGWSQEGALAALRRAVRDALADVGEGPVLVACSGGRDSMALLAATVAESRRRARRATRPHTDEGLPAFSVVGMTVDHGLQQGSAEHAATVARRMATVGADETRTTRVSVTAGGSGPEAAARDARYAALAGAASAHGAPVVLLGHTRDDQAETVLLGLARGSGGRSLAGMRPVTGRYRRPLLGVSRQQTEQACLAEGLPVWDDPHNEDPRFLRSRVRQTVLPVLERELGPGVSESLARTAEQLQVDDEALRGWAAQAARRAHVAPADGQTGEAATGGWDARVLAAEPPALLRRVVRQAAVDAGALDGELFAVHVRALADLVTGRVRGEVQLPGHLTARLTRGVLRFHPTPPPARDG